MMLESIQTVSMKGNDNENEQKNQHLTEINHSQRVTQVKGDGEGRKSPAQSF